MFIMGQFTNVVAPASRLGGCKFLFVSPQPRNTRGSRSRSTCVRI